MATLDQLRRKRQDLDRRIQDLEQVTRVAEKQTIIKALKAVPR